jgi:hypothetical protein
MSNFNKIARYEITYPKLEYIKIRVDELLKVAFIMGTKMGALLHVRYLDMDSNLSHPSTMEQTIQ